MENKNMSYKEFTRDNKILEERLKVLDREVKSKPDEFDARLQAKYIECNGDDLSITIEFPVLPWEANYVGILHGGVTCAMLDHTAGVCAICFRDEWAPTVDLDVHFLRKAEVGDTLISKAEIEFFGHRIVHMRATLTSKTSGKTVATALATYLNN